MVFARGAQLADLRAGRLDLGVLHADPDEPPAGVELALLARDALFVALPADHRYAHRTVLRLAELRDDPLVAVRPEPEADTHARYLDACARAGFVPRPGPLVSSLGALLGFVAADLGWAFVAETVARGLRRDGVVTVRLSESETRLPTALAWSTGPLAPAATLVREAFGGLLTADTPPCAWRRRSAAARAVRLWRRTRCGARAAARRPSTSASRRIT